MEEKYIRTLAIIILGAIAAYLADIRFVFYGFIIAGLFGIAFRVFYFLWKKNPSKDES